MDADAPHARRTLQACRTCRRRKTKCDGVHPSCRHCTARGIPCIWPSASAQPSASASHPPAAAPISPIATTTAASISPIAAATPCSPHLVLPAPPPPPSCPTLTRAGLQRCIALFCERHLASTFCSFVHRPDLEALAPERAPFLATAIVCLCARYLSPAEARALFGESSGPRVGRRFTPAATAWARATLDDPRVAYVQANLVLAVAALLDHAGSSHWMYAGTAIRMAQVMRLNQDYHQQHPLREQEVRRRTFWACFAVDKLLAHLLAKPATLALANVHVALPGTDAALAYGEASRGLTLHGIASFAGYPSDLGLLTYLLKTVALWSRIADHCVCRARFVATTPPTDPASAFSQCHAAMRDWDATLQQAAGLHWTPANRASHAALGQGRVFVALHLLVRSAFCVAHDAYLPHLDGSSVLLDAVDAAGWSLLHREPSLLAPCVASALAVGAMVEETAEASAHLLQSVWVASSLLSVSNTLLWLQYAGDADYSDEHTVAKARHYFGLVTRVIEAWSAPYKAARQWLRALRGMHALYRAAYLGEVDDKDTPEDTDDEDNGDTGGFRPRAGDGFPPLTAIPNLYASLRFLASDTSAEPKKLPAVWMSLVRGWSLVNLADPAMRGNAFSQFT